MLKPYSLRSFAEPWKSLRCVLPCLIAIWTSAAIAADQAAKPAAKTADAPPQIKLLGAGSEPRTSLRLRPKAGDKQTLTLKTKMSVDMGMAPPMKVPEITMTMNLAVKNVSSSGDISYEMTMTDASLADDPAAMPMMVEPMKKALAGLKGLTGKGTVSSRGVSGNVELSIPPGADAQSRQFMDQMKDSFGELGVAFPEEAVGVGGKWEVRQTLERQGMKVDQTNSYELKSINGDQITVSATLLQHAANQKIENPSMPGFKMDLELMEGKGSGQSTLGLTKPLPQQGTASMHTETSMSLDMGGQKQAMKMKADTDVRFESK